MNKSKLKTKFGEENSLKSYGILFFIQMVVITQKNMDEIKHFLAR